MHRVMPFAAVLVLLGSAIARSEDWSHWRGERRNDTSRESSGFQQGRPWPARQSSWEASVGEGSTSPLVIDGRLYTMGWRDGEDHLVCLDAASGQTLWRVSYAAPQYARHATGDEGLYSGVTATPEFDAETGLLYTLGTDGALHCWDTRKQGAKVWGFNLYDTYETQQRPKVGRAGLRDYGYTTSPLVYQQAVIVEVGDEEGNLMAFDKRTGRRLWTSQSKDAAGHTGGLALMQVENVPCVVVLTLHHLLVARLDAGHQGRTVAEYSWETDFAQNIASPVVHQDSVLITGAYNHDSICRLRITLSGAQKVWESPYPSGICTPIVHQDRIYWSFQRVRCLDFKSGQQLWEGGNFGDAGSCILTSDQRLIVWGKQGKLACVETAERSPDAYAELAVRDGLFNTDVWPHVVLSGGKLFCKDRAGNLVCFGVE